MCDHCFQIGCIGGLGQIDHSHLYKNDPDLGMLVVKIGGPAYRIGMGGGAASSVPSGSNSADLDFNAVQVGWEQKLELVDWWQCVRSSTGRCNTLLCLQLLSPEFGVAVAAR